MRGRIVDAKGQAGKSSKTLQPGSRTQHGGGGRAASQNFFIIGDELAAEFSCQCDVMRIGAMQSMPGGQSCCGIGERQINMSERQSRQMGYPQSSYFSQRWLLSEACDSRSHLSQHQGWSKELHLAFHTGLQQSLSSLMLCLLTNLLRDKNTRVDHQFHQRHSRTIALAGRWSTAFPSMS